MKKLFKITFSLLLILTILFGFALPVNPPAGNWYQQFLPNIGNRTISDIFFIDSLTGWAVTPYSTTNDTSYVLKTTNKGDNWLIQHIRTGQFVGSNRVFFLNANTGYTAGVSNLPTYSAILKTTNGGNTWSNITPPTNPFTARDISILNEDTFWVVSDNSLTGGVYRTTNGGANWDRQIDLGSQNPGKIYMYNARIGFFSSTAGLYKTTNSGVNWFNASNDFSFSDIFFIDSLRGWKAGGTIKMSTNGGLNWINQPIPQGGNILGNGALRFMNRDNDTIWAVGEELITGGNPPLRGILFRTTNSGNTWQYQLPDTAIHINRYFYGQFINNKFGWAYHTTSGFGGIHTTNGGDTTFITGLQQISSEVPKEYFLYQNYPNPFNPKTNIKYQIANNRSSIRLVIYDIIGKEITTLVNEEQLAGTYQVDFSGIGYSSGIYFYSLIAEGKLIGTRKMILIK